MGLVSPMLKQWIADQRGVFPDQQSDLMRHRCTADSMGDVVPMLEQARHDEVASLVFLDISSAFDSVPDTTILESLDGMGVVVHLRSYVQAFLAGETLRVKVGRATSSPQDVRSGVTQGSVLSPFLFNLMLDYLPDCVFAGFLYPAGVAVYVDRVAMGTHGPTRQLSKVNAFFLQGVLGAFADFPRSRGLQLSEAKTKAMTYHPRGRQLTWIPAVRALQKRTVGVQRGVWKLLARVQDCSPSAALRVFHAMTSSAALYAMPLVHLQPLRCKELEIDQRRAMRLCLGLPSKSPDAATYTEAGSWTIQIMAPAGGLHHIHRPHSTPDGAALLQRYRNRPYSQMGMLASTYESHIELKQHPHL
ncbi:uncharacterized protein LOC144151575 [Haemaphysalis longicornis]